MIPLPCLPAILAASAALALVHSPQSRPGDDQGWVELFDGRSLDGWVTSGGRYDGTARWTVEDGCLTGRQGPDKSGGLIYTVSDHANFELELDVKIDYPFDSGVFVRMTPWAKGAQVTLDHRPGGEIGGIYSDGWLQHTPEGAERFRKDEWNHVRVRCTGRDMRIDAWLNGEPLVSYALPKGSEGYARTGLVGLQVHGGEDVPDETKVQFRNVRLRELAAYRLEGFVFADSFEGVERGPEERGNTLRVRERVADPSPGWRPLFDGERLAGWSGEGGDPEAEVAPRGVLRIPGTGSGHLRTDELYRDFQLRLDVRFSAGANSGLFLRGDPEGGDPAYSGCELQILDDHHWEETTEGWLQPYQFTGGLYGARPPDATDALNPVGDWNVYEVTFRGSRLTVFLNGKLLHDVDTLTLEHARPPFSERAPEGFVGLQAHGSATGRGSGFVEFRNLFVRPLAARTDEDGMTTEGPDGGEVYAAVDLGSNSFHLLVARGSGRDLEIIDRLRERVALAEGLDEEGRLDESSQERAIACLSNFGQRLREVPAPNVRAVGTNTFRAAGNARRQFRARARAALGHRIEVVSGLEEARLIYLGVAHDLGEDGGRRLVIDIGGGSTELILGEGFTPVRADSLYIGHVGFRRRFFADGRVTSKRMARARKAAAIELETVERAYRRLGWTTAVGSSGTALAVQAMIVEAGLGAAGITADTLKRLEDELVAADHCDAFSLPGLKEERRPVIAGGVALMQAVVDALRIDRLGVSDWALREGLLYDLLGRAHHDDVRERTVARLEERHAVDRDQAARVEETALALFEQARLGWDLDGQEDRRDVAWAARLHEIGISLSYSGHHRHGAYLIQNSNLPGFSRDTQARLAALVLGHRRRLRWDAVEALLPEQVMATLRLCLVLRLSVVLHRARSEQALPELDLDVSDDAGRLSLPRAWLERHPLTLADLEVEAGLWSDVGHALEIRAS